MMMILVYLVIRAINLKTNGMPERGFLAVLYRTKPTWDVSTTVSFNHGTTSYDRLHLSSCTGEESVINTRNIRTVSGVINPDDPGGRTLWLEIVDAALRRDEGVECHLGRKS